MARRRFYARDSHGRFARTAGKSGVYKKKTSTRRKVAYAAGVVAIVGGAAVGGRELYRAGGRKGFEYGKKQGIKEGKPLRGPKGKFLSNDLKRDYSQNPFARGFRPVGKEGRARKAPKIRTAGDRVRQATRIRENKLTGSPGRKEGRIRRNARRKVEARRSPQARAARVGRANARRYNDAQSSSRIANSVRTRATRASNIAGQKVARARVKRRKRVG